MPPRVTMLPPVLGLGHCPLPEQASPSGTSAAGRVRVYAKSDGKLYLKDDAGAETALDAATAGAVMKSLFDAYSLLAADSDDTPVAVALALGELVGRARTSGGIVALDAAKLLDVLSAAWHQRLDASTWYDGAPAGNIAAWTPFTLVADRLYAIPFWTPRATTWASIGIYIDTAEVGKKFKMGVYEVSSGSSGDPGTRLLETAEQSLDSTGNIEVAISLALDAGKYFWAIRSDSTTAKVEGQLRTYCRLEGAPDPSTALGTMRYTDSGTYAANGIPATWPGSTTISNDTVLPSTMLKTGATP